MQRRKAAPARPRAPDASPAGSTAPRRAASPGAAAPRFSQLIRVALESVGVRYVSVELLRKAKRNSISERERRELWQLLHDIVMLVVADFDVDFDELARANSDRELGDALSDPELHHVQVELVRFYLYEWGFLCSALYAPQPDHASGQVLLLAFAWLVAYSKLLERQHQAIVEDVALGDQVVAESVAEATRELRDTQGRASHAAPSAFEDQIHQLHMAYGRLQYSVSELLAYHRYHQRLLLRLEDLQSKSVAASAADGGGKHVDADEPLPASILQLLTQPKSLLDAQLRTVACSLQMLDDEILFYKWVNGVVTGLSSSDSSDTPYNSGYGLGTALEECKRAVDAQLQADACRQLAQSFKTEWQKWKQLVKGSRSRVEQMEAKLDAITQQIQRTELMDPQKLFLLKPCHESPGAERFQSRGSVRSPEVIDEELKRLETQLERVLSEITSEYCHLSLQ